MNKTQYAFLILLLLVWLGVSIYTLNYMMERYEILSQNPLSFVIDEYELNYCNCMSENSEFFFNHTGYSRRVRGTTGFNWDLAVEKIINGSEGSS